jgi:PIN domain nuclease of toxin-antitoxin system
MKILIDTHVFLWFYPEPQRISHKAKLFLEDTLKNDIFVSPITAWEISIKYGIAKLSIPDVPEVWFPDRVRRAGFLYLPLDLRHMLRVHNLPPHHKDPFDRLLISQADYENLPILTEDPRFSFYNVKTLKLNDL